MGASTVEKEQAINEPAQPLRHKTAHAALTSGAAELVTRVVAVALSIATARMLEPREVGILGLAVIVTGIISMIGCYPETAAVAAHEHKKNGRYATVAMLLRMLLVVFLLGLLTLTFPACAELLTGKEDVGDQLRQVVRILIFAPALEAIGCYPQVVLQRRLDLSWVAGIQILQPFIFVGLAIILLLDGYGSVGVVWASLTGTMVVTVLLWLRLWRMNWIMWEGWPDRREWREVSVGSAKLLTGGFGGYVGARVDNLLVAGALGPTAMSFYSMAWNASRVPIGICAKAISFVLVPTFARLSDDPMRTQRGLRESLRLLYLVLAPICAILMVSAPSLVTVLLGAKWLPLVPCLRVMCFTVLVGPLLDTSYALLISQGRAQFAALGTSIRIGLLILLLQPMASRWGLIGAAYADLISSFALTVALYLTARFAARQLEWRLTSALALPLLAAVCAGLLAWRAGTYWPAGLMRLIGEAGCVLIVYPMAVSLFGGRDRLSNLAALLWNGSRRTTMRAESHA